MNLNMAGSHVLTGNLIDFLRNNRLHNVNVNNCGKGGINHLVPNAHSTLTKLGLKGDTTLDHRQGCAGRGCGGGVLKDLSIKQIL